MNLIILPFRLFGWAQPCRRRRVGDGVHCARTGVQQLSRVIDDAGRWLTALRRVNEPKRGRIFATALLLAGAGGMLIAMILLLAVRRLPIMCISWTAR